MENQILLKQIENIFHKNKEMAAQEYMQNFESKVLDAIRKG